MARIKPKRHGVLVDMTAMTDVAFLLLTFFILTTEFKQPDVEDIVTPSSISKAKLTEGSHTMTISVTKDGRYYFSPTNNNADKIALLEKMGEKYKVEFSDSEKATFQNVQFVGVPMAQMKKYLQLTEEQRKNVKGGSVPLDSTNKQLIDWVQTNLKINRDAKLAVKGDGQTSYEKLKVLFEGLRDIEMYKFVLVTTEE
ncbi:MAG: biopolymer transporter ExbD [Flavobacteriaceae bacterium]|nr:biopolymer transporter ExbD [Flavobacteriaceae bacterium]